MSSSLENNNPTKAPFKDRIIPWYFVMLFAVVFAVNGLFVYLALSTRPGVVNERSFEAGVSFNHIIEQSEEQKQRGWKSDIVVASGELQITLINKNGSPISDAEMTATLTQPVSAFDPQKFKLISKGSGLYTCPFTYPSLGQWDIKIDATWNNQPFHQTHRMIAK